MSHGLTGAQLEAFGRIVQGRRILDVGAGPLAPMAVLAAEHGALEVVALDKSGFDIAPSEIPPGVALVEESLEYAAEYCVPGRFDLLLLSWPWLVASGAAIEEMLLAAPELLYLGKNTGGVRCGAPVEYTHQHLWQQLSSMRVLEHVPAPVQVLTLYDTAVRAERVLLDEEQGALSKTVVEFARPRL